MTFEEQVAACQTAEELKLVCRNRYESDNLIATERGTNEVRVVEAPRIFERPAPARQEPTSMRVIYPHGNIRCELYGVSETDLNQQEQAIREFYRNR